MTSAATLTRTVEISPRESLLRAGFAVYMLEMAAQIAMVALFYDLPKPVNRKVAIATSSPARVQIHEVTRVTSQRVRLALVARHDTPHITEIGVYNESVRR